MSHSLAKIESERNSASNASVPEVGYDPRVVAQLYGAGANVELDDEVDVGQELPIRLQKSSAGVRGFEASAGGKPVQGFPQNRQEFDGVYDQVSKAPGVRRSKVLSGYDPAMYPFNIVAGSRSGNKIIVGRDDRMSPREANSKLASVLTGLGIESAPHEFVYDFTRALFITHALNGASVVGPGRAKFHVANDEFSYGDILKMLGPDVRRFFRAYADDIARALSAVLFEFDPGDHDSIRLCGQIRAIAVARGLVQFPYLIHDSADACVKLSPAEMAAVVRSKELVLSDNQNSIDALTASTSKK